MTMDDRVRWEQRHAGARLAPPCASVLRLAPCGPGEIALDLACGQGRHTLALLAAGYAVVAVDVSRNALEHLQSLVPGAPVLCVQADVDQWPLREEAFNAVVVTNFLDRRLYAAFRSALRPGGELLIDTFVDLGHPNAEGPSNPDHLLRHGELALVFADLEVLEDTERDGPSARAIFRARKRPDRR